MIRHNKPYVFTMLAPATSCNQRCPRCYLTEIRREPVESFALKPHHFSQAVDELMNSGANVLTVCFQGYEVTLPQSWPYVEAVFSHSGASDTRRCFITNGMRLHALIDQIIHVDPTRIAVSLDGADSATNDRHRGVEGAWERTLKSMDLFIRAEPSMQERLMVASVLYEESNFASLLRMPALMADRGITSWCLGLEVAGGDAGEIRLAEDPDKLIDQLSMLDHAAQESGISFFVGDEFSLIEMYDIDRSFIKRLPNSVEFLRLLPSGHLYCGKEAMRHSARPNDPCWRPDDENFVTFLERCLQFEQSDLNDAA